MPNNCCLKFDFRKVDQHAGGKWLIHDTKRCKDNQLQSLKLPCRSWVARCDIKGSVSTVLYPIFSKKVQGQKHPGRGGIVEQQIPSIKVLFKTNTKGHKHPSVRLLSKSKIVACRRPGDKPLSDAMVVRLRTQICVTQPQWVMALRLSGGVEPQSNIRVLIL